MSKKGNNGSGFLKEKLGNYRVDPPAKVWDSIEAHLGNRKRRNLIIVTLSAAASLALAVTLGVQLLAPWKGARPEIAGAPEELPRVQQPLDNPAELDSRAEVAPAPQEDDATRLEERVAGALREIRQQEAAPLVADAGSGIARDDARLPEQGDPRPGMPDESVMEAGAAEEPPAGTEERRGEIPVQMDEAVGREQGPAEQSLLEEPEEEAGPEDLQELIPGMEDVRPGLSRWNVTAVLSPLYSYRDAESSALAGAGDYESGMLAYAGGIQVGYRAGSRLAVESGIFYNRMGISIGSVGTRLYGSSLDFMPLGQEANRSTVKTITNSVGNIVASSGELFVNNYLLNASGESANVLNDNAFFDLSSSDEVIRQHLEYMELPLNLRYSILDRSVEIQLVGGLSANFLVNNSVTMETADGISEIGYLVNIRQVNYSGNAGVGMVLHLMDHLSLRLEPRFRYFLNSINDRTLPSTHPYTMGFYTGLSYRF